MKTWRGLLLACSLLMIGVAFACVGQDPTATSSTDGGGDASPGSDAAATTTTPPPPGSDGQASCDPPRQTCGTACTDTSSDPANCGGCGRACGSGFGCEAGVCGDAVVGMAAGLTHVCASLAHGDVYCWGDDTDGQLGQGDAGAPIPHAVWVSRDTNNNAFGPIGAFSLGVAHSCGLAQGGKVFCWGSDDLGQLSDDHVAIDATAIGVAAPQPAVQKSLITPAGVPYTFASLGSGPTSLHTCGTTVDGGVACWGSNGSLELGHDGGSGAVGDGVRGCFDESTGTTSCDPLPYEIPGLGPIKEVATGPHVSCALGTNGVVTCWGDYGDGARGDGVRNRCVTGCTPTNTITFPGTVKAVAIALGDDFGCIAGDDGHAYCWGHNDHGELGHDGLDSGTYGDVCCGIDCGFNNHPRCLPTPAQVPGLADVTKIYAGDEHACAIEADGTLWCWGQGDKGELGNGTTADSPAPSKVSSLTDVAGAALGAEFSCAFTKAGAASCWGKNDQGQLGNGTINSAVPIQVQGL